MNDGLFHEVELLDEQGKPVKFDHVMTFFHEKVKYIALLPLEKIENVGEDEIILLRVTEQDGEDRYESIENPVLLEEVFDVFLELFDEMQEEEDSDSEE